MRVVSCDGLGAHPLQLLRAQLRSFRRPPEWGHAGGKDVIYTYQGRNAIALLCRFVGLRPGDEVLAPAYNCGAEIDPFIKAGARVVLYDVGRDLSIDIDGIARSITPSTRVVHVTHFFGVARCIDPLAAVCKRRGVLLVEDCAQALFSGGPGGRIGRTGDAAIYSFVKTLPAPDGGALVVDRALSKGGDRLVSPPLRATFRGCLPLVKKWLVNSTRLSPAVRGSRAAFRKNSRRVAAGDADWPHPPMLASNCFVEKQAHWTMSQVSRGILQSASVANIVETRRQNFNYLLHAVSGIPGVSPVIAALPEGACPMAFPFIVEDRSHWCSQLETRGILVQGWPGYYPGFDWDAYPQACYLKDRLLTLPVHQGLNLAHMEYIAECVREVARQGQAGQRCSS